MNKLFFCLIGLGLLFGCTQQEAQIQEISITDADLATSISSGSVWAGDFNIAAIKMAEPKEYMLCMSLEYWVNTFDGLSNDDWNKPRDCSILDDNQFHIIPYWCMPDYVPTKPRLCFNSGEEMECYEITKVEGD